MTVDPELLKGTLSLLILSLLRRGGMYGYEIARTVRDESDGALEWKEGSLYPSLHKLDRDGLVRAVWREKSGARRRKYYRLTPQGRRALEEKMQSWGILSRAVDRVLGEDVARQEVASRG